MKSNIDEVISMAWSDKISFEEIKKKNRSHRKRGYFYNEKKFKKKSYIVWRKRVRGRISKHRKKTKVNLKYYEF